MSTSSNPASPVPVPDSGEVADPVIPGQLPLAGAFDDQPADQQEPAPADDAAQLEQVEPPAPVAPPVLDEVAAAAVELARAAAVETAGPDAVGAYEGVAIEADGLVLHTFACLTSGYRGWAWAVTLARPADQPGPTVCEVVLLPQSEAVLAPEWLPWSQRLAPGDLGPGDELPYREDDPNLVPGYTVTDEADDDQELFWELGLGRERVLGPDGVRSAAARWRASAGGPDTEVAIQASAPCNSCGYFVSMSGLLRLDFGVCANEWSPSDGRVVTADHGCGAHSETDLELPAPEPLPPVILDESLIDEVDTTGFADERAADALAATALAAAQAFAAAEALAEAEAEDLIEAKSEDLADAETGADPGVATLPAPERPTPGDPGIPVPDEPTPGLPDPTPEPGLPEPGPTPGLPEPDPEPVLPIPGLPEPGIATAAELDTADAIESSQVESQPGT